MTSPASGASTSTSSISGLISGMDTTSVVSQLMQIESQPKVQLTNQLANTQTDAAAYRDINTSFAALASAAAALTNGSTWATAKATSSDPSVVASASSGAATGSVSFTVSQLASTHTMVSTGAVPKTSNSANLGNVLTLTQGTTTSTINIADSTGTGNPSLDDVITAINKSGSGITASTIFNGSGYVLQVRANGSGLANAFSLAPPTGSTNGLVTLTQGDDAKIMVGAGPNAVPITSSTNTFSGVLSGTTFTVGNVTPTGGAATTVTTATDPTAIAGAVSSMVAAANTVLSKIKAYTDSSTGSTAPLKGDWGLNNLAAQVLDAVSTAVGKSSAGSNGVQLTQTGTLVFSATDFQTAFAANPAQVQAVFSGTTSPGADNVPNTGDDKVGIDGVGARLAALSYQASDKTTGTLTGLANGQDTRAKDIQSQIDAWTLRLAARQQTLTAQFTAMETALGTLKNQSSWLTSQINSLPTTAKSN
jgi:flagellar hook-associated protein 2